MKVFKTTHPDGVVSYYFAKDKKEKGFYYIYFFPDIDSWRVNRCNWGWNIEQQEQANEVKSVECSKLEIVIITGLTPEQHIRAFRRNPVATF